MPKPPTNAMKGLLKKSLISVADAVRTIFLPNSVAKPLDSSIINLMIVHIPFKNYYRLHGNRGGGKKTNSPECFLTLKCLRNEKSIIYYQIHSKSHLRSHSNSSLQTKTNGNFFKPAHFVYLKLNLLFKKIVNTKNLIIEKDIPIFVIFQYN